MLHVWMFLHDSRLASAVYTRQTAKQWDNDRQADSAQELAWEPEGSQFNPGLSKRLLPSFLEQDTEPKVVYKEDMATALEWP